jgi:hypothetical protein
VLPAHLNLLLAALLTGFVADRPTLVNVADLNLQLIITQVE